MVHNIKEFVAEQEGSNQMVSKDFNEGTLLEGLVLGHPDIMRKFNIKMKDEDLELQARLERIAIAYDESIKPAEQFRFIELAPEIFQIIRRIHNISEKLIRSLLSMDNASSIRINVLDGTGGTFFLSPE